MKITRIMLFTALALFGMATNMGAHAYCSKPDSTPEDAYKYAYVTVCSEECDNLYNDDYDAKICNECKKGAATASKATWDTYYSCVKAERLDELGESDRVEDKVRY